MCITHFQCLQFEDQLLVNRDCPDSRQIEDVIKVHGRTFGMQYLFLTCGAVLRCIFAAAPRYACCS